MTYFKKRFVKVGLDALAPKDKANHWAELFVEQFKKDGFNIEDLQSCNWKSIITSAKKLRHSMLSDGSKWFSEGWISSVIDNKFIKENYIETYSSSEVDLIAGTTLDEYKLWIFSIQELGKAMKCIFARLSKMFDASKLPELISAYSEYLNRNDLEKFIQQSLQIFVLEFQHIKLFKKKQDILLDIYSRHKVRY